MISRDEQGRIISTITPDPVVQHIHDRGVIANALARAEDAIAQLNAELEEKQAMATEMRDDLAAYDQLVAEEQPPQNQTQEGTN